ncbi:MAG: response regulator transcription factor [Planctomycetota bacterium]|jgi:DNA-binding response OmpR family regulator
MSGKKVLVVEDDSAIRRGLVDALEFAGYGTLEAADGEAGLEAAVRADCDLILLDLVLPGPDGLSILREARAARPTLPVIILTARGAEDDRVEGLRLGADDYVAKPFSIKELLARVDAVLRRSPERPVDITAVDVPGGTCDFARLEVRYEDGERAELTEREAELFRYLAANRGRAISREEILQRVWRINPYGVDTRTIDMHIAKLREKLRDDPAAPKVILTVRGKGYSFGEPEGTR